MATKTKTKASIITKSTLDRFGEATVIEQLKKFNGFVHPAAQALGVDRSTLSHWIAKHPVVKQAVEEAIEVRLDVAEGALDQAIGKGEAWATCFFLKCRGQKRGYVEKQQIEFGGEVSHVHSVDLEDRIKKIQQVMESRAIDCVADSTTKLLVDNGTTKTT